MPSMRARQRRLAAARRTDQPERLAGLQLEARLRSSSTAPGRRRHRRDLVDRQAVVRCRQVDMVGLSSQHAASVSFRR